MARARAGARGLAVTVACLHAGAPPSREVRAVLEALRRLGHRPLLADLGAAPPVAVPPCDVALNLMAAADAAAFAALLARRCGARCVPSPAAAHLLCADRMAWRALCRAAGVPVIPAVALADAGAAARRPLRFPLEVRARGATWEEHRVAWNRGALVAAVAAAGGPVLAERTPAGRQFAVALLGASALPVVERTPQGAWRPATAPAAVAGALGELALRTAAALRLRDAAVLRFVWDGRRPVLIQPEARPDLTARGALWRAATAAGLAEGAMWDMLLNGGR